MLTCCAAAAGAGAGLQSPRCCRRAPQAVPEWRSSCFYGPPSCLLWLRWRVLGPRNLHLGQGTFTLAPAPSTEEPEQGSSAGRSNCYFSILELHEALLPELPIRWLLGQIVCRRLLWCPLPRFPPLPLRHSGTEWVEKGGHQRFCGQSKQLSHLPCCDCNTCLTGPAAW